MSPTFAQLGVPASICDALEARGITQPFEIQAATIADALDNRDVCGRAPTGSGKTLAFGIPLVATVGRADPKSPRGLVLAPTRELADQISKELRSFSGDVRIGIVYGGVGYTAQINSLRKGVDILVACPGRLEDLIESGHVNLRAVNRVVLDEADRMADMGFMPAVRRILDQTDKHRQTVLFSATLDGAVAKLTRDYQNDPARHEVGEATPDITVAEHVFWKVDKAERAALTAEAVTAVWPAIIFCRTRHGSDRLAKQLGRMGVQAAAIHGGRSQNQRTRALADFANNRVHALVATDVAARGIHVDGVASVIHYDPSEDHKTYVHRSGRTARAGEGGVVVSLVQPDQVKDLRKMQKQVGLDEPITAPAPEELHELSDAPTLELAAPIAAQPKQASKPKSKSNNSRAGSSSSGRGNNRHRNKRRNGNSSGGNSGGGSSNGRSSGGGNSNGSRSGQSEGARSDSSRSGGGRSSSASTSSSNKSSNQSGNKKNGSNSNRPNRKARRAHLQPGANQS